MQTRRKSCLPVFAAFATFLLVFPRPGASQVREYIYMGERLLAIEGPAVAVQFSSPSSTVTEAQDAAPSVTVIVPGGGNHPGVTVSYTLMNGTAVAGQDFVGTNGQPVVLPIPAGPSGIPVPIPIDVVNDAVFEDNETFSLVLSNPTGAVLGSPTTHLVTILDDEPTVEFVLSAGSVTEGPGVSHVVDTRLVLRPGVTQTSREVNFTFATSDGTAQAALGDYAATSGPRSFPPNTPSGTLLAGANRIVVPIGDDAIDEPNQDFFVDLTSITGGALGTSHHTVTIADNDPTPSLSIGNVTVPEGDNGLSLASLDVTLSGPSEFPVSVLFNTADGSALGVGRDYWGRLQSTMTFPFRTTSKTVRIPVVGDNVAEPAETFFGDLSGPQNATILDGRGDVSITDADASGLAVNHATTAEGRSVVLTVTLPSPPAQPVTVSYQTLPGTATPGVDYQPVSGTLTISPPASTASFNVNTVADGLWENQEGFAVQLSGSSGPPIAYPNAKVTIVDLHSGSDFDADRQTDLLWRHTASGEIALWYLNRFQLSTGTLTNPSTQPLNWKVVGTGSFPPTVGWDLLWWDEATGNLQGWQMSKADRIKVSATTPAGISDTNWRPVVTGDFDADGKTDIVWRHGLSGEIAVWFMDGYTLVSGTFTTPPSLPVAEWEIQGAADMDSNGTTDLVWRHLVSGELVVWFMNGAALTSGSFMNPEALVGNAWQLRVVRDFDGDGKPDLAWRNSVSGENVIWWMDGHILKYGEFGTPLAPGGWTLAGPR